jgi:hypothetical protein
MDFLHEDPKAEREYIKRLMKHRREPSISVSMKLVIKNPKKIMELDRDLLVETKIIQTMA